MREKNRGRSTSQTSTRQRNDKKKSYATYRLTVDTSLGLRIPTDFKRLATLDFVHARAFALVAGKFQDDLLRSLRFFVKHWFGLTPVTRLFSVVTAFTCLRCEE